MKGARNSKGMSRPRLGTALLLGAALCACQAIGPRASRAQSDDPGLIRTLETDSASVENAYYLWTYVNNDTSPDHGIYLYGEGLFTLWKDWGLEADFPNLYTRDPLGRVPLVLGPIGLYLRYEAFHFGGWNSETAGAFSIEAGGAYGFSNSVFRGVGSSWTFKLLGGVKVGPVFLQGNYGYQGGIDSVVQSQWQANTGLGASLGSDWYAQGEADFTAFSGPAGSSWSFIPQVAFQPGEWLFELGESLNESPAGITEVMVARTF